MPTKHSQFRRRMMALADGGHVRGPGSGTSDSIPARLSDGEFVLPADTVREVGVKSLRDLVSATHQPSGKPAHPARFADGGLVDDERQRASSLQKFDIGAWEQQMNQDRAAYTQKSLAQGQAAMEQAQANAEAAAAARPTDGGVTRAGAGVPAAPSPAAPAGTGPQGLADRIAQIPTGGPKAPAADGSQNSWANTEVGRNLTNLANALPGAAGNMVGQAARSGGAISNAISSGSLALGGVSAGAALGAASTAAAAPPAAAGQKPLPAGVSPSTAGAGRGSINPPAVDPSRPLSSTAAAPSDGASPGYGPIGDRTTLTNEQAAIMNPAGRITVTRGANGSMEFSGGNVSGQVSYNDASGKALAGGGLNGKGFSAFDVAPAGGTVATGPNGSYAFAERGESQASSGQRSPVGMTVEQAQREGLVGERVGYDPRFDQRLNDAAGQPSTQNMQAADKLATSQSGGARVRLMAVGTGQPQTPGVQAPTVLHSGNSWQARNDLRNLEVAASSITNRPEWRSGSSTQAWSTRGPTGRADPDGKIAAFQAALKEDVAKRGAQPAYDMKAAQESADLQREGMRQDGATNRATISAMSDAERNQISRDRLALDQTAAGFQNRTAQRIENAQTAFENAKTPEQQRSARERLLALSGKSEGELWAHSPGGQVVDPKTQQLITQPGVIYNRRTGETRVDGGGQERAPQTAPSKDALVPGQVYQTPRGPARWDGGQFQPVR